MGMRLQGILDYNRQMQKFVFRSIFLFICSACVLNPVADRPDQDVLLLPSFGDLLPDGGTPGVPAGTEPSAIPNSVSLRLNLERLNVNLSAQEWEQLSMITQTAPTGRWSKSIDKSPEQNLIANFQRFSPLFSPPISSAEAYRAQAVAFAEKATVPYYLDLKYYLENKRLLVVKWDANSGEFLVVQSDGTLVNYLITQAVSPPRYLEVVL